MSMQVLHGRNSGTLQCIDHSVTFTGIKNQMSTWQSNLNTIVDVLCTSTEHFIICFIQKNKEDTINTENVQFHKQKIGNCSNFIEELKRGVNVTKIKPYGITGAIKNNSIQLSHTNSYFIIIYGTKVDPIPWDKIDVLVVERENPYSLTTDLVIVFKDLHKEVLLIKSIENIKIGIVQKWFE